MAAPTVDKGGTDPDGGLQAGGLIVHGPYEDLPEIASRRPRWGDFAAWWDASARGQADDAMSNLAAGCNVRPGPGELAALCEEWGFLAVEIAGELLGKVGAPDGDLTAKYPCVRAADVRGSEAHPWREVAPVDLLDRVLAVSRRALLFKTPAGLLAMRPPGASVAGPYQDAMVAVRAGKVDASTAEAARALELGCAIEPPAAVLAGMIEEYPALVYCLYDVLAEAGRPGKAKARPLTAP